MIKFPIVYPNGTYNVTIKEDGTKIRESITDEFIPRRVETIDINISNKCYNNCEYCYIDATPEGEHADLFNPIFDTIPPYTEIAINYSKHPQLPVFLRRMKDRKVIVNMTANIEDVLYSNQFEYWQENKLIYGLGISVGIHWSSLYRLNRSISLKNTIFHTIVGINKLKDFEELKGKKVLILGYKSKGRGRHRILTKEEINETRKIVKKAIKENWFEILSFDNLALEQLDIKSIVSEEIWNKYYMGEDGIYSFYLDMVKETYAISSLSDDVKKIYNMSIMNIFNKLKNGGNANESNE